MILFLVVLCIFGEKVTSLVVDDVYNQNRISTLNRTKFSLLVPVPSRSPNDCSCGVDREDTRYFKGIQIVSGEMPWLVGFVDLKRPSDEDSFCFGSIINDRYILTTASCLHKRQEKSVGVNLIGPDTPSKLLSIAKFKPHPRYNKNFLNDIALVRLSEKIDFVHHNISPICLEKHNETTYGRPILDEKKINVVTWWKYSKAPDYPWIPYFGRQEVQEITKSRCASLYPSAMDANPICLRRYSTSNADKYLLKENSEFFCHIVPGTPVIQSGGGGNSPSPSLMIGMATKFSTCSTVGDATKEINIFQRLTDYLVWIQKNSYDASFCS